MKKLFNLILIGLCVVLLLPTAVALAGYTIAITVTNLSATSYDMVGCNASATVSYWETAGFIGENGTDVRMYLGASQTPFMLADDRVMAALPLTASSSATLTLETGDTAQDMNIITGYSANTSVGYIKVTDAANLELSDNFTITINDVWIDTDNAANKYIIYKADAMEVYVDQSTAGVVNFVLYGDSSTEVLRPNGAGYTTELGANPAVSNYLNVDEVSADDDSTYNYHSGGVGDTSWDYDGYNITDTALTDSAEISSISVFQRVRETTDGTGQSVTGLRLNSTNSLSSAHDMGTSYVNYEDTISRPGGGSWSASDLDSLQIVLGLKKSYDWGILCTQTYATVYYREVSSMSISGVTSGEYDIEISANTTSFSASIGASSNSTTLNSSMANNSNDWYVNYVNAMPYMANITIDIDGVEQLYYSPNDLIVTPTSTTGTLPDRGSDATNNAGTIYFGGNPTSVNMSLGVFISDYTTASVQTSDIRQDVAPTIQTRVISASEAAKLSAMQAKDSILYPLFSAINGLTTPGIPIMMMYEVFFLFITVAVMFVLGRFGHLFIMVIAGLAIMGFATAWGVFDFPLIIMLVLIGGGFLWMQGRQAA